MRPGNKQTQKVKDENAKVVHGLVDYNLSERVGEKKISSNEINASRTRNRLDEFIFAPLTFRRRGLLAIDG